MSVDQNIKFAPVRKGYNPQEVDMAFDEMQKQIATLEQQRHTLSDTISQYNEKIRQFEASTKRLEDERAKESLRIVGVLDKAVWAAGETEQEASKKAAEIITAAQMEAQSINGKAWKDSETVHSMLTNMSQDLQVVRQVNQQFCTYVESTLDGLDILLKETLSKISSSPAPTHMPAAQRYSAREELPATYSREASPATYGAREASPATAPELEPVAASAIPDLKQISWQI